MRRLSSLASLGAEAKNVASVDASGPVESGIVVRSLAVRVAASIRVDAVWLSLGTGYRQQSFVEHARPFCA